MYSSACFPSGVPAALGPRSMSPVEICGSLKSLDQLLGLRALACARGPEQYQFRIAQSTVARAARLPASAPATADARPLGPVKPS